MKKLFRINSRGKLIKNRRFLIIDRAIQKAKKEIMEQEDSMFYISDSFIIYENETCY